MWREFGRVDGLTIGMMGDLKYGRTVPSLSYMLTRFSGVKVYYIAPRQLQVREEVIRRIEGRLDYRLVENVENVIEESRRTLRHQATEGEIRGPERVREA